MGIFFLHYFYHSLLTQQFFPLPHFLYPIKYKLLLSKSVQSTTNPRHHFYFSHKKLAATLPLLTDYALPSTFMTDPMLPLMPGKEYPSGFPQSLVIVLQFFLSHSAKLNKQIRKFKGRLVHQPVHHTELW